MYTKIFEMKYFLWEQRESQKERKRERERERENDRERMQELAVKC
jgi:hypothetical protein